MALPSQGDQVVVSALRIPRWKTRNATIARPESSAGGPGASSECPANGEAEALKAPVTNHRLNGVPHRMELSSAAGWESWRRGLIFECLCLEDRCSRAEALSCSSVLESWRTRFQVS